MTILHQAVSAKDAIVLFNMHIMIDFCLLLFLKHLCLLRKELCSLLQSLFKSNDANTPVSEPRPGPTSFHWGLLLPPPPLGRGRASTPFYTQSGDENFHYFSIAQLKSVCKLSQVFTEGMEVTKNPSQR